MKGIVGAIAGDIIGSVFENNPTKSIPMQDMGDVLLNGSIRILPKHTAAGPTDLQ